MSDESQDDNSLIAFGTTLGINVGYGLAIFVAFSLLRSREKNIYIPKTYMVSEEKRPLTPPQGLFSWVLTTIRTPDETLLKVAGLDAFMFIKFLKQSLMLFTGFTIITLIVLLPLNILGENKKLGLNQLTMGNIKMELHGDWTWAHIIFMVILSGIVVASLFKSVIEYAKLKQDCLLDPEHSTTARARTLLIASIPNSLNHKETLKELFDIFPGGVKYVSVNVNVNGLPDLVQQRDNLHYRLEQVLTSYIVNNVKAYKKSGGSQPFDPSNPLSPRPKLRLTFFGDKVDSIDYYHRQILELNAKIINMREHRDNMEIQESAFILFNTQLGAHVAAQTLISNHALHMTPRYTESDPDEVIWSNLNFSPYELMIRGLIGTSIATAIAILWFVPVSFVASISKLEDLKKFFRKLELDAVADALTKLLSFNPFLTSLIQGLLPVLLLSILTSLVPIIFTILSKFQGYPRLGDVQLSVMSKYFWFLVFTVLLASTLGSSVTELLQHVKNTQNNPRELFLMFGSSLPTASSLFINYVLLKSLMGSSQEILQVTNLVKRRLLVWLFTTSPRKKLSLIAMEEIKWGILWPEHTLVFAIGIVYAIIAPFSNIFITLYFLLFYVVYRYQMLYVYQTEKNQSTGMFFMKAVSQIFVGIYLFHITFIGIMLTQVEIAKSVISLATFVLTIIAHTILVSKYEKLVLYLPVRKVAKGLNFHEADESSEMQMSLLSSAHAEVTPINQSCSIKMPDPEDCIAKSTNQFYDPESGNMLDIPAELPDTRSMDQIFSHPALVNPQPKLWVPRDHLGIYDEEIKRLNEITRQFAQDTRQAGTSAFSRGGLAPITDNGSTIDEEGKIKLSKFSMPEHS